MTGGLNSGKGRCHGSACLTIQPVRAVVELGALPDVVGPTLKAVHHANRNGEVDDFIAVAFPQMHKRRGLLYSGPRVDLIGSEASLSRFAGMDSIKSLYRREMIKAPDVEDVWFNEGDAGVAYVRDRTREKTTEGRRRRIAARAERRGRPVGTCLKQVREDTRDIMPLFYGNAVIEIRKVVANFSGSPLLVSTYGFSSPTSPAVLPVLPDSGQSAFKSSAVSDLAVNGEA